MILGTPETIQNLKEENRTLAEQNEELRKSLALRQSVEGKTDCNLPEKQEESLQEND